MMQRNLCLLVLSAALFSTAGAQQYVFPAKGQKPEQQKADEASCHTWAVQQSGFAYDGETSHSVELGAKLDLFARRAQLNIALFRTKYKDLQVSAWDPVANATLTRNAADATSKGVEVELTARISRLEGMEAHAPRPTTA